MASFTVLYPLDCYEYGGVTTIVRLYTRAVRKMGGTCVLVGYQGDLETPRDYFSRAHVIVIPRSNGASFLERCIGSIDYLRALREVYKTYDISLIHFSTTWSTLYTLLHYRSWRIKRISTFHGAHDLELRSARLRPSSWKEKLGDACRWCFQYIGLALSERIIVLSRYASRLLRSHFPIKESRVEIIPGYVQHVLRSNKRDSQSTKPKILKLLNIGRAEPRKGISLLFAACARLRDRDVPFTLTVASPVRYYHYGDLEAYESLHLLYSVRILHKVDQHDQIQLMRHADVFIMPSLQLETFGLTALESLTRGIPVIATPTGALPEILARINPHLISRRVDADSLAERIVWYWKLPRYKKNRLRDACRNVVRMHFSEHKWQPEVIRIYGSYRG